MTLAADSDENGAAAYPAPVERPSEIVAGTERQNGDRWWWSDAEAVDGR